MRALLAKL
uniref:Uncharacterized protein n=1 Tax=Timema poppense TaxID=170557 RepID=A0A7R9HHY0_TIMPO|nr:unnamed protein product [Timema poppensis]